MAVQIDIQNDQQNILETETAVFGNVLDNDTLPVKIITAIKYGNLETNIIPATLQGTYGVLQINADGNYSYSLDSRRILHLAVDETVTDTFQYVVDNNPDLSGQLTLTIEGSNNAPTITVLNGDSNSANLIETDALLSVQGTVTVNDIDDSNLVTSSIDQVALSGNIGLLTAAKVVGLLSISPDSDLAANSKDVHNLAWQFNANGKLFDYLGQSQTTTLTYSLTSSDGLASANQDITITITGTNDAPIAGAIVGKVSENFDTISGNVAATDPDNTDLTYQLINPAPQGLVFNKNGSYQYTFNKAVHNHLAAGATKDLTVDYKANDGQIDSNTATLTLRIVGINDAPVATSKKISAIENGNLIRGRVSATDVDDGDNAALTYALTGAIPAGLSFNKNGSYSFNPKHPAYDPLKAGEKREVVAYYEANDGSVDSNKASLTISITGTNDVPTITGVNRATVTESTNIVQGDLIAIGKLNIDDIDEGQSWFVAQPDTAGSKGYGSFSISKEGRWTYSVDNNKVDSLQLKFGDSTYESFIVSSLDGSETKTITLNINGATNVAPTFTGNDPNNFDNNPFANPGDNKITAAGNTSITAYGGAGNDILNSSGGMDTLYGGSGDDKLNSGGNNDRLYGGSGNDVLDGGIGDDVLVGGGGADNLKGGDGNDVFKFLTTKDTGDTVVDFSHVADNLDKIDLSSIDADIGQAGNQVFAFIPRPGQVMVSNSLIWFITDDEVIIQADTDGDLNTAELQIVLTGTTILTAADFIL